MWMLFLEFEIRERGGERIILDTPRFFRIASLDGCTCATLPPLPAVFSFTISIGFVTRTFFWNSLGLCQTGERFTVFRER